MQQQEANILQPILAPLLLWNTLIHRLRNCREISELAGIFLGYQIPPKWYILGFGTQTNILTPLSLYPWSSPPPGEPAVILKNGQWHSFLFYQILNLRPTCFWGELSL